MVEQRIQRWHHGQGTASVRPQTVTRFGPEPQSSQAIAGVSLWQPQGLPGRRGRQLAPEPVVQDQPLALQSPGLPLIPLAHNPFASISFAPRDDRPQSTIADMTEPTARSLPSPPPSSPQPNSPADTSLTSLSPPPPLSFPIAPSPHRPTPPPHPTGAAPPLETVPSPDREVPLAIDSIASPPVAPLRPRVDPPPLPPQIALPAESASDAPPADQSHQGETEPVASPTIQAPAPTPPPSPNSITPAVAHVVFSEAEVRSTEVRSQVLSSPASPAASSDLNPVGTAPPTVVPHSATPLSPHLPISPTPLPSSLSVRSVVRAQPTVAYPSAPQPSSVEATFPPDNAPSPDPVITPSPLSPSPPLASPNVRPVGSIRPSVDDPSAPQAPLAGVTPYPSSVSPKPSGQASPPPHPPISLPPITVTIGRIDICATSKTTPTPPRRRPNPAPSLSLKDYLDRRNRS
jgi:hypothetical protein